MTYEPSDVFFIASVRAPILVPLDSPPQINCRLNVFWLLNSSDDECGVCQLMAT